MGETQHQQRSVTNRLSKSRFMEGLRCPRALYLSVHNYDAKDQPTLAQQARFDAGNAVGELARRRYVGGVLIEESHLDHGAAMESTRSALASGAPAIFEAAFAYDDIKVRVDVLRKLPNGAFELIEVKSTGGYVEAKHLPDAAVQLYVLDGCGIDVQRTTLLHMNKAYVYEGGAHDPQTLFAGTDITTQARAYLHRIPETVAQMKLCIAAAHPPTIEPGPFCHKPYDCGFIGFCGAGVTELDMGGELETVEPVLSRLDGLPFPLHFVDFETLAPAVPLLPGTSPFQPARVQWSMHTLRDDGTVEHREWLATDTAVNPDEEFVATLLAALGDSGTFVHYSPFERTQLIDIALRNPPLRQPLVDRLPGIAARLNEKLAAHGEPEVRPRHCGLVDFDLGVQVVRPGCLHPAFGHRQYSIKTAIKLLAPHLPPYEGFAVSNGDEAMAALAAMLDGSIDQAQREQIRRELLAYCEQDTRAMLEIFRTLTQLRKGPASH